MDIKATVESLIGKITGDGALKEKFQKDPLGTAKGLIGDNVPEETLKQVVDGVQAKLKLDDADGLLGKVKGIFGK